MPRRKPQAGLHWWQNCLNGMFIQSTLRNLQLSSRVQAMSPCLHQGLRKALLVGVQECPFTSSLQNWLLCKSTVPISSWLLAGIWRTSKWTAALIQCLPDLLWQESPSIVLVELLLEALCWARVSIYLIAEHCSTLECHSTSSTHSHAVLHLDSALICLIPCPVSSISVTSLPSICFLTSSPFFILYMAYLTLVTINMKIPSDNTFNFLKVLPKGILSAPSCYVPYQLPR